MKKAKKFEQEYKEGRPIKEVVPPIPNKYPRDHYIHQPIENYSRNYNCEAEPFSPFPEWPGDEYAKVLRKIN